MGKKEQENKVFDNRYKKTPGKSGPNLGKIEKMIQNNASRISRIKILYVIFQSQSVIEETRMGNEW